VAAVSCDHHAVVAKAIITKLRNVANIILR